MDFEKDGSTSHGNPGAEEFLQGGVNASFILSKTGVVGGLGESGATPQAAVALEVFRIGFAKEVAYADIGAVIRTAAVNF